MKHDREIINSVVNDVTIIPPKGENRIVRKRFKKKAKLTGIMVPANRSTIEYRLLKHLPEQLYEYRNYIMVPEVVKYNHVEAILLTKYINGYKLPLVHPNEWPYQITWETLGRVFAKLENLPNIFIQKIFNGLLETQQSTRQIILNYKILPALNNLSIDLQSLIKHAIEEEKVVCLGDVGISNMLFFGQHLLIFDFEFAHIGARGYDLGQLIAQFYSIIRRVPSVSTDIKCRQDSLLKGYSEGGGQLKYVFMWAEAFLPYYQSDSIRGLTLFL